MNLKQLAQHLGLSQTTVSRALNGYPEVSEDTRQRVLSAAKTFHYSPNANARRLATGRAGALGVAFPIRNNLLNDPLFMDFLAGVVDRSAQNHTDVLLSATTPDDTSSYQRLARVKSVDCVILSSPLVEDPRVPLFAELDLPLVVHGRTFAKIPYAHIDIDNEGAFRRSTELLIGFGHKRIALINGEAELHFAFDREAGWKLALEAGGLHPLPNFLLNTTMTEDNGYRLTRELLAQPEPPTAIICSSIYIALGAYRALGEAGLVVGRDMSLVAHDDGTQSIRPENMNPPLTTTFSSIRAAGVRAAEIALEIGDGADPADYAEIWPVDLIFRESISRPPNG